MLELQGTPHANKVIFRADLSQLNPEIIIVIFSDGTQTNVPANV